MRTEFDPAVTTAGVAQKRLDAEFAQEFSKIIENFKEQANTEMLKRKQDADDKAAEEAKRKKEEKINELIAMISRLKGKIALCRAGESGGLEAQLSQLESELLMLLLFS